MATYPNPILDDIRDDYSIDAIPRMLTARLYAAGRHTNTMTPAQRRLLFPQKIEPQTDNVVKLILNQSASRLKFAGWDVEEPRPEVDDTAEERQDDAAAPGPVQAFLDEIMMRNRLAKVQFNVHFAMYRDGNTAVSIGWRGGRGRVYRESWWDGESGIFVGYDRYGDPEWAVKQWTERKEDGTQGTVHRRTVYYADHFIRYVREGSNWEPIRELDPEDEARLNRSNGVRQTPFPDGSVSWEKSPGDPLGLPVIHFANGSREDTPYGESEIADQIGTQDQLNAMQDDIAAASRFTGFQMIWVAGNKTEGGKLIVGPGRLLEFTSENAKAGVLPAGDMSKLTEAHGYKRATMAINTQTPIHTITGAQWPSGEAIFQADMPSVDKANRSIEIVGPEWSTTGHRLTEIANVYGVAGLDENAPIEALMEDPRRIDELTEVRILAERAKVMETIGRIADPILIKKLDLMTDTEFASFMAMRNGLPDPNAPAPEIDPETGEPITPDNVVAMF